MDGKGGWMHGWMWVGGRMDGWLAGWMDGWMFGWMDMDGVGGVGGWMDA